LNGLQRWQFVFVSTRATPNVVRDGHRYGDPLIVVDHHIAFTAVTVHHTFTIDIHIPVRPNDHVEPKGNETHSWAVVRGELNVWRSTST
jgi:hypothetical protein